MKLAKTINIKDNLNLAGLLLVLAAIFASAVPAMAQPAKSVRVEAVGQAPVELPNAREAAIENALRKAVETGGGVELASVSQSSNYALIKDVIYTKTAGLVETYKVLLENPDQEGLYTVKVSALISRGSLDTSIAAWKALLRRKGHPKMMVVGSVDKRPFDRRLTAELQGMMERRNMTVIDLEMLSENQRKAAQRAANGELDPKAAAIIASEAGADYFVIAAIEGSQHKTQSYGIDLYRIDATAILKVVATDSAQIIASEVRSVTRGGRQAAVPMREATSAALADSFEAAVGRIGANWLDQVDQRGGSQIDLIIHNCDFDRLSNLCRLLRAEPAIKDVIVDSTDAEARSFVRVISNETTANIAAFIRGIDPGMKVRSITRNQIQLKCEGVYAPPKPAAPAAPAAPITPAKPTSPPAPQPQSAAQTHDAGYGNSAAPAPPADGTYAAPDTRNGVGEVVEISKSVLIGAAIGVACVLLLALLIVKVVKKA